MNKASGNPAGILDPMLTAGESLEGSFYHAAMHRALDFYSSFDQQIFLAKGLLKHARSPSEKQKFTKFHGSKINGPKIHGQDRLQKDLMSITREGNLYFPGLGAISPPKIKDTLTQMLAIKNNKNITHFTHDQKWHLYEGDRLQATADAIVLCCGPGTRYFSATDHLPLEQVRGQITFLDAEKCPNSSLNLAPNLAQNMPQNMPQNLPNQILCAKGYIIPPFDLNGHRTMIAGATFSRNDTDLSLRAEDHAENLKNAENLWPDIGQRSVTGGRCGIRAYSPDHMPLCGPVADHEKYQTAYQMLKHGPQHKPFPPAPYMPNLYTVSGLGARGFLTAPLLGDIIAALMTGRPLPVTQKVYEALHPARFLIRTLTKGK